MNPKKSQHMKKLLFISLFLPFVIAMAAAPKKGITRIDPTDWFVGMKNPKLQLMVYGPDIAAVKTVTTDYPGVTIDEVVRPGSPNYLLVYLDLSGAQPGEMTLQFDKKKYKYQLKAREMSGDKRM
jgi:hypothetical protein